MWLLHKFKAYIKGFPICVNAVQAMAHGDPYRQTKAKRDVTDTRVVTLSPHLKGNAELLSSCASNKVLLCRHIMIKVLSSL